MPTLIDNMILKETWQKSVREMLQALGLTNADAAEFLNIEEEEFQRWIDAEELGEAIRCDNCGREVPLSKPNPAQSQGIIIMMEILAKQVYPSKINAKIQQKLNPDGQMPGQQVIMQSQPQQPPPNAPPLKSPYKTVGGGRYL